MDSLRHQAHPQGRADTADGIEARLSIGAQRFIQRLAGEARGLGNLAHAASAGDVAQRGSQQGRIVRRKNVGQISRNCRFATKIGFIVISFG
jgi:hypothetical protein